MLEKNNRSLGITIYPYDDFDVEKNLEYIRKAAKVGFTRIFISFFCAGIETIQKDGYLDKIRVLTTCANELQMRVQADFFPEIFAAFHASSDDISEIIRSGIDEIRIDYGFSFTQIAQMTKHPSCKKIIINASELYDAHNVLLDTATAFEQGMKEFRDASGIMEKLEVGHNMYPREGTGLSMSDLISRNAIFERYKITTCAFCNSKTYEYTLFHAMDGSPTIEEHREFSAYASAHELFVSDAVQSVFIADGFIQEKELASLSNLLQEDSIALRIHFYKSASKQEKQALLQGTHLNRGAAKVIRSMLVRSKCALPPQNCVTRNAYDVTIDNELYERYFGEIQILLQPRKPNERVNVVARLDEEDIVLLQYLKAGKTFHFVEKEELDGKASV